VTSVITSVSYVVVTVSTSSTTSGSVVTGNATSTLRIYANVTSIFAGAGESNRALHGSGVMLVGAVSVLRALWDFSAGWT
jgi:hypothetical protein